MENKEWAIFLACIYTAIISLAIYMMIFNPVIRENPFIFIIILVGMVFLGILGIRVVYVLLSHRE